MKGIRTGVPPTVWLHLCGSVYLKERLWCFGKFDRSLEIFETQGATVLRCRTIFWTLPHPNLLFPLRFSGWGHLCCFTNVWQISILESTCRACAKEVFLCHHPTAVFDQGQIQYCWTLVKSQGPWNGAGWWSGLWCDWGWSSTLYSANISVPNCGSSTLKNSWNKPLTSRVNEHESQFPAASVAR